MKFKWREGPWERSLGLDAADTPAEYRWRGDGPFVCEIIRTVSGRFKMRLYLTHDDDPGGSPGETELISGDPPPTTWEGAEDIAILHLLEFWRIWEIMVDGLDPPEELRDLIDAHRIMKP